MTLLTFWKDLTFYVLWNRKCWNAKKKKKVKVHLTWRTILLLIFYNISAQMLKYNPAPETCGFRLDTHDFYAVSAVKQWVLYEQIKLCRDRALLLWGKPMACILFVELFRNSFSTTKQWQGKQWQGKLAPNKANSPWKTGDLSLETESQQRLHRTLWKRKE